MTVRLAQNEDHTINCYLNLSFAAEGLTTIQARVGRFCKWIIHLRTTNSQMMP